MALLRLSHWENIFSNWLFSLTLWTILMHLRWLVAYNTLVLDTDLRLVDFCNDNHWFQTFWRLTQFGLFLRYFRVVWLRINWLYCLNFIWCSLFLYALTLGLYWLALFCLLSFYFDIYLLLLWRIFLSLKCVRFYRLYSFYWLRR